MAHATKEAAMDSTLPVLKLAVKATSKFLQEAENSTNDSAKRCEKLLCAAREAIKGLYNEPAQIIVAAQYCDLAKKKDVNALMQRIGEYQTIEELRPLLATAIEGLEVYLNDFRRDRHYFIKLFTRFVSVDEALDRFGNILDELIRYHKDLHGAALKNRVAGSGLLLPPLQCIKKALERRDRNAVIDACSTPALIHEANRLNDLTGKISTSTHELLLLFAKR